MSTLVLADDDPIQRKLATLQLEQLGFDVIATANGRAALQAMREAHPAVVLSDVLMPEFDGFELCRAVRSDPELERVPVVLITSAYVDEGDRRLALDAGASAYVERGSELTGVADVLRSCIRQAGDMTQAPGDTAIGDRDFAAQHSRRIRAQLERQMRYAYEQTIMRLAIAAESRHLETAVHTERVGRYSALLAERAGIDVERVELIRLASVMHDVGKIGVPDAILLKPGPLTEAEFDEMRKHTTIGHRILAGTGVELLNLAATIALTHHERIDGSGYPFGIAGDAIPVEGRIVAITDVYDALTSDRLYRPAWTEDAVLAALAEGRGTHFDPELLDLFLMTLAERRHSDAPAPV